MKSFDFECVVYCGEYYCTGCLPDGISADSEDVSPVFAGSEVSRYPVCCACGTEHTYMSCPNLIREWSDQGYELRLYDDYNVRGGKTYLRYDLAYAGRVIFSGTDLGCSPMHSYDSDHTVAACLHFLSLQPGDTDPDYFAHYTQAQIDWVAEHGDELSELAMELESEDDED